MVRICRKCNLEKPESAFELLRRKFRRAVCERCRQGLSPAVHPAAPDQTPSFARKLDARRYLVTAAQNNTFADANFLAALLVVANRLDAELVVVPYRYKNPTGMNPGRDLRKPGLCRRPTSGGRCLLDKDHAGNCRRDELWWDPAVEPFLFNGRKKLHPHLTLAADVKVQATASQPLTGFEALTGAESCIIAHPKLQFKTVPVPSGRFPKILTTTGAITARDYSNTKAGAIGEFHHTMGACLVECDGKRFHLRQIIAGADGSFTDLDTEYTAAGWRPAPPALALVMGDTHVRVTDKSVDRATFGPGGIVEALNPQTLVWHDVFDGETVNPHERGDLFLGAAKTAAARLGVRQELQEMVNFVLARSKGRAAAIVDSNHHDFLRRWIVHCVKHGFDHPDLSNLELFGESIVYMAQTARMEDKGAVYGDPFHYWVAKLGGGDTLRCLNSDEPFSIAGVELGMHGNNGPNGAKGTAKNLARLGVKSITGHTHAPSIEEGHYTTGTSTPRRLAYQKGPGSHLNTHCVLYASGKRCLLTVIDENWRAK